MEATMTKERPILFSAPMVRAILAGRKTQTRRIVKPQPTRTVTDWTHSAEDGENVMYHGWPTRLCESRGRNKRDAGILTPVKRKCPYGVPGDRLWVRESWQKCADGIAYRATDETPRWPAGEPSRRWKPSIHMPREASRITLEVTGVRVERVQAITEADARLEGLGEEYDAWREEIANVAPGGSHIETCRDWFTRLWDSINGDGSWASNPWVWVVEFKRK